MSNDLSQFQLTDQNILKSDKHKKKSGKKTRKKDEDKLSVKRTVNFTKKEDEQLIRLAKEAGHNQVTVLIRSVLKKEKII